MPASPLCFLSRHIQSSPRSELSSKIWVTETSHLLYDAVSGLREAIDCGVDDVKPTKASLGVAYFCFEKVSVYAISFSLVSLKQLLGEEEWTAIDFLFLTAAVYVRAICQARNNCIP